MCSLWGLEVHELKKAINIVYVVQKLHKTHILDLHKNQFICWQTGSPPQLLKI